MGELRNVILDTKYNKLKTKIYLTICIIRKICLE